MKRLHVHIGVQDLETARRYYSAMFGEEPVVIKEDYLKWTPAEPAVNFAVSSCTGQVGLGHLGVEGDGDQDLLGLGGRLRAIGAPVQVDGEVTCCYARSSKAWSEDPAGISWEIFHTSGDAEAFAPAVVDADNALKGFETPSA